MSGWVHGHWRVLAPPYCHLWLLWFHHILRLSPYCFFFFSWASAYEDHSQGILLRETCLANSILVTFPMRNLLLCYMYIYFLSTIYTLINGTPHTDGLRFFPFVHLTFHSCTSSLTTMLHVLPTSSSQHLRILSSVCSVFCWVPHWAVTRYYLINSTIFGKKELLNIKCVFWFSLQLLLETFLILRQIQLHIVINVEASPWKVPVILVGF